MAGKKSKEVRASQVTEAANKAIEESVQEWIEVLSPDRGEEGAIRSNEGVATRIAEGVTTRSQDNVAIPPLTLPRSDPRERPRTDARRVPRATSIGRPRSELIIRLLPDLGRKLWLVLLMLVLLLNLVQVPCI